MPPSGTGRLLLLVLLLYWFILGTKYDAYCCTSGYFVRTWYDESKSHERATGSCLSVSLNTSSSSSYLHKRVVVILDSATAVCFLTAVHHMEYLICHKHWTAAILKLGTLFSFVVPVSGHAWCWVTTNTTPAYTRICISYHRSGLISHHTAAVAVHVRDTFSSIHTLVLLSTAALQEYCCTAVHQIRYPPPSTEQMWESTNQQIRRDIYIYVGYLRCSSAEIYAVQQYSYKYFVVRTYTGTTVWYWYNTTNMTIML